MFLVRIEKKKTNFLLFFDIYVTFQVIFLQCMGSKGENLIDFLLQGQPVLKLRYRKVHNLTLISFSLPTFIVEWTELNLSSHGELSTAGAMGIVAYSCTLACI